MMRLLLFAISSLALGQASTREAMVARSVQVIGAIREGNEAKPAWVGGGFVADAHHVVTTLACCDRTKEGKPKVPVVRTAAGFAPAKLVWNGPGRVAIVEVEKEIQAPPLILGPGKLVQKGQPVYAVTISQKGEPTISETNVEEVAKPDGVDVAVIRMKATSDSVDSGGALFDACGGVVGINMFVDNGAQFAFIVDALAGGIQKNSIRFTVLDKPCSAKSAGDGSQPEKKKDTPSGSGEKTAWRLPQGGEWIGVAIIVGLLGLALRRGTSGAARARTTIPDPPPYVPVVPKIAKPVLRGVAGQYAGSTIPIESATTLGRDPRASNLVFGQDSDSVSKRHCSVRWDAGKAVFVVEDLGSTNGTFLATGERIGSGQARELRPGQKFYLGDHKNQFEVALE
jgi:hypothetical protein